MKLVLRLAVGLIAFSSPVTQAAPQPGKENIVYKTTKLKEMVSLLDGLEFYAKTWVVGRVGEIAYVASAYEAAGYKLTKYVSVDNGKSCVASFYLTGPYDVSDVVQYEVRKTELAEILEGLGEENTEFEAFFKKICNVEVIRQ